MTERKYQECEWMFTDGSKTERGVGAAVVWRNHVRRETLPREASVYTAEMQAVGMAVNLAKENPQHNFAIFSDS